MGKTIRICERDCVPMVKERDHEKETSNRNSDRIHCGGLRSQPGSNQCLLHQLRFICQYPHAIRLNGIYRWMVRRFAIEQLRFLPMPGNTLSNTR
jgi:hypothetical protein